MNQQLATTTTNPDTLALARLLDMLTYRRPAGSVTETAFIERFIEPTGAYADEYGNYWLTLGKSRVIWSCHTDTVHAAHGIQEISTQKGLASVRKSSCLGADCTAGAWIMLEMIAANIPGCYVFHRDEETGGRGSSYIEKMYPDILACYDFAIAFDRRGTRSIITHQGGRRGASEAFSASIAPMLPAGYASDPDGLFTDTANYVDHVSECSNLSVGYSREHSPQETLDLMHAMSLRAAMVKFDETRLVSARDKTKEEYDDSRWGGSWLDCLPSKKRASVTTSTLDEFRDLLDFCRHNPDAVADFLEAQGFTVRDLDDWKGF